jgi:hypothetical protein
MSPQAPADTDAFEQIPASPIADLQLLAPLILDVELREGVLAAFDGPKRLEAEGIFPRAARLASMTEWPEDQLLEALGCTMRTVRDMFDDEVELEALQRCRAFLGLVTRTAGLVDTVPDRRQVVADAARLLKAVGEDVPRLEGLMRAEVGECTAIDFIRMGELEAASERVRRLAGIVDIGAEHPDLDAFAEVPEVHLSTSRIDMLLEGRREELGQEVSRYMELHIAQCSGGCQEAYEYRKAHLPA